MAVCDLCKGTGRLLKPWYDTTGLMTGFTGDICFKCDGKGTIGEPMTNEEWFDGLSTEEKAETIANATYSSAMMGAEITALPKEDEVRKWKMWLKAPHDWKLWLKQLHKENE